jgi:hypothetical protein
MNRPTGTTAAVLGAAIPVAAFFPMGGLAVLNDPG